MKNTLKKATAVVLAVCNVFAGNAAAVNAASGNSEATSSSYWDIVWDFGEDSRLHGGTNDNPLVFTDSITSPDGEMTINANADRPVWFKDNMVSLTINGQNNVEGHYNTCLSIGGENGYVNHDPLNEYRTIEFHAWGPCDVYVVAKSGDYGISNSNRETREFVLFDDNEYIYDTADVYAPNIYKLSYNFSYDKDLYLGTLENNLHIYYIAVVGRSSGTASTVSGWDFSDPAFSNAADSDDLITSDVTSDGLTVKANASPGHNKPVKLVISSNSVDGFKYNQCIDLMGEGTRNQRSIHFFANADSDIYITARSSGPENRTLMIRNIAGASVTNADSITVTPQIKTYKVTTKYAQKLHLSGYYDGGIRIYSIYVVPQSSNMNVALPNFVVNNSALYLDSKFTGDYEAFGGTLSIHASSGRPVYYKKIDNIAVLSARTQAPFLTQKSTVSFKVPDSTSTPTSISLKASSEKTIYIANAYGHIISEISPSSTPKTTNIVYNGHADELYIYCVGGYVNIYSLQAVNSAAATSSSAIQVIGMPADIETEYFVPGIPDSPDETVSGSAIFTE